MGWKSLARARSPSISARSSSSMPKSPAGMAASIPGAFHLLDQEHLLDAVDLLELHLDDLDIAGLHHAPHEARFDGQFAMAAVDENEQLNARRTAVVEKGVERGADGAAGVEHVVHQDDVLAFDVELDVGGADDGFDVHRAEVVAVEVDIEDAHGHLPAFERFDF